MKHPIRKILGWILVLSLIVAPLLLAVPMQAKAAQISAEDQIQNGTTLHCWNWSFQNIEKNMAKIASQGYTAIQVSPIQQAKQSTKGSTNYDWWVYYQPIGFHIDDTGNSALGNKAQFKSMCQTAHQYGIYVIVDVVANHLANGNDGSGKSPAIIDDIEKDSSCWHNQNKHIDNYWDRWNITQCDLDGVPDLNTGSSKIQNYVLDYLKECVDAGADGFRFDAVKHIETPQDAYCSSSFWPTVIDGIKRYDPDVYCYGELLYHADEGKSLPDSAYTNYFSVTDNSWSNTMRDSVVVGRNAGAFSYGYHKDVAGNKLVLWAESHDTYAGNENTDNISAQDINKTWALVAARADAMSLYLARPDSIGGQKLGDASQTGWSWSEVGAVNRFHNAFVGQDEWVANEGGIAYVERGDSGVVLVDCTGTSGNVNVKANMMKDGTYTDQVSGNTFTVSGGRITGNIGNTGIAVVYNAKQCSHESHDANGICTQCRLNVGHSYGADDKCACGAVKPGDRVVYFKNTGAWSKVNIYSWYSDSSVITAAWPGDAMTKVSEDLYSYTLPGDAVNVIFNDGAQQTDDLLLPKDGDNMYSWADKAWSYYDDGSRCVHSSHDLDGLCTDCGAYVGHSYVSGKCVCGAVQAVGSMDYYLIGYINGEDHGDGEDYASLGDYSFKNGPITTTFTEDSYVCVKSGDNTTWYMTDGWQGEVTSVTLYDTADLDTTADKLLVPGGVQVTFTLAENSDGTLTLSYTTGGQVPVCDHASHGLDGRCTACGKNVGHSFVGGECACGAKEQVSVGLDYYLIGYINGEDHGDGEDYASLGDYSFKNGPITTTFTEDSYVCVKSGDNTTWYMTDGWQGEVTSVTLYNTADLDTTADKLLVPGGVQVTFTLAENSDGTLTLSYTTGGQVPVCDHASHGLDGLCTACGKNVGHSFVGGECACGAKEQVSVGLDYYLIGYINGEDHGDGEDYASLGDYSFKNGPITTTFTQTSYVCVKSGDNTTWYMTDGWQGEVTSVTLYKTADLDTTADKLLVPGGVRVTFTLVENSDGTLTLSYTTDGTVTPDPEPDPQMEDYYLFGWIGEMNYACEENSDDLGEYKLVDGKLVTTFATDSYVGVKSADNSKWYMTDGWLGTEVTSAKLYDTTSGIDCNKLYIPGGVQVQITLVDDGDGSFTLSYAPYSAPCQHPGHDRDGNCTQCGVALGHSYEAVITDPTCTEGGYSTYTCACGDSYVADETPATGHSYVSGSCTGCGHTPAGVQITKQPVSVAVRSGAKASVSVTAKGDGLSYKWYYAAKGSDSFAVTDAFTGNAYSVTMTSARNGRQVYCVVTDAYGNSVKSDVVRLDMKTELKITKQPVSVKVGSGESAKVTVTVQGDGLTYEWYYANAGSTKYTKTSSFTGDTYKLTMTSARNGRKVYCIITDQYGDSVKTNTVSLRMKTELKILTQPTSVKVAEGKTAKVSFKVQGDGLKYQWYYAKKGSTKYTATDAFTSNYYSVKMNATRNGRKVYCVITDAYGNSVKTKTVSLNMRTPLKITAQPTSVTVANGKTAKVTVGVQGDGLTYKWYYADGSTFKVTNTFTSNYYSIKMNDARSGRKVYCVITDKYGNTVKTNTVTLKMK